MREDVRGRMVGKDAEKGKFLTERQRTRIYERNSSCEVAAERNERNAGLEERLEKFQVEFLNFQLRVSFSKLETNLCFWVDHFIKCWNFHSNAAFSVLNLLICTFS